MHAVLYTIKVKFPLFGPIYCVTFFMVVNFVMLNIVTSIVLASFEKVGQKIILVRSQGLVVNVVAV